MQCKCTIKFLFKYMPCTTEIVILFYFSINEVIRWPVSEERGICSSPQWAMKHPQRNVQSTPPTKATNHWWRRSCCGAQQPSLWPTAASSPSSSPPPKKLLFYRDRGISNSLPKNNDENRNNPRQHLHNSRLLPHLLTLANPGEGHITNPSKDGTKQNCLCVYIVKVLCSHLVYFQTSKMLRNFCVYALALMATK